MGLSSQPATTSIITHLAFHPLSVLSLPHHTSAHTHTHTLHITNKEEKTFMEGGTYREEKVKKEKGSDGMILGLPRQLFLQLRTFSPSPPGQPGPGFSAPVLILLSYVVALHTAW